MSQENQTTPCPVCGGGANGEYTSLGDYSDLLYWLCTDCGTLIPEDCVNRRFYSVLSRSNSELRFNGLHLQK